MVMGAVGRGVALFMGRMSRVWMVCYVLWWERGGVILPVLYSPLALHEN